MIEIRRWTKGDSEAVLKLIVDIMDKEFQDAKHAYPMEDVEAIDKAYSAIGEAFFVAVDKKSQQVIGTVAVKKEDERTALLRRLFVSSNYRNQKVGRSLVGRALEFAREVGYHEMIFKTTSKMSGAIELCRKNGFVQRAHIVLGPIELIKLALALNGDAIGTKRNS